MKCMKCVVYRVIVFELLWYSIQMKVNATVVCFYMSYYLVIDNVATFLFRKQ